MFASALFENEHQTDQILHAIETLLREGETDLAAERLEVGLEALEEFGHPIVSYCRAVPVESIELLGWENLAERLRSLDTPGAPITAIGIDISSHSDQTPDSNGHFEPFLETNYYSDKAFPFSAADRRELVAGYTTSASEWQGHFEDIDGTITVRGMDELNAAVAELEQLCRSGESEDGVDHDALLIGSAFVAVRLHQAVKAKVLTDGLPRALTVLVGSNESYPFFDAPVLTRDENRNLTPCLEAVPVSTAPPLEDFAELAIDLDSPQPGSEIRRVLLRHAANSAVDTLSPLGAKPAEKPAGLLKRIFARR